MSNNNYAAPAAACVDQLASVLDDYLSGLDADALQFPYASDEIEAVRSELDHLLSALAVASVRLDHLRYADPLDPWATPVTRRSLRSPRRWFRW